MSEDNLDCGHDIRLNAVESCGATVNRRAELAEAAHAEGVYRIIGRDKDGNILFNEEFHNVVCSEGKDVMLDSALSGSAYTVVGPYMGLVNSVSPTFSASDTSGVHPGWVEATTSITGNRPTVTWSASSGGTKAATNVTFNFTGSDTISGCAVWYGTGAVNTKGSTTGKLLSAGSFGGNKTVGSGDSITVVYSFSI